MVPWLSRQFGKSPPVLSSSAFFVFCHFADQSHLGARLGRKHPSPKGKVRSGPTVSGIAHWARSQQLNLHHQVSCSQTLSSPLLSRFTPILPRSSQLKVQLTLGSDSDASTPSFVQCTFTFPPRWAVTQHPISSGYEAL